MEILDAQLHCWKLDRPSKPWRPGYHMETRHTMLNILIQSGVPMPPEALLVEMAAAGVDGGVLTPQAVYGSDSSLELETALDYPRKFAAMCLVDNRSPNVDELIDGYVARGALGIRTGGMTEEALLRGDFTRLFDAVERNGLAVAMFSAFPFTKALDDTLSRYSGIRFMIDHLGIGHAPPAFGLAPDDPWELLPQTLGLAKHPNVSLKLTGASALSHESYPFRDVWTGIKRIVDAFGPDRVLWGTDITRTGSLHTYAEATQYLREIDGFTNEDLELMYGQALRKVMRWDPDAYLRQADARRAADRAAAEARMAAEKNLPS